MKFTLYVFHQVFLQVLFLRSWNSAQRGLLEVIEESCYIRPIQEKCHSSVCLVHTFNINRNCKNEFLHTSKTHISVEFAERL